MSSGTTLYVLCIHHFCNHQKEIVGLYTSEDKAKEAAQTLCYKYCDWRNNFMCDGRKRDTPSDYTPDIIDWNKYEDQQTWQITKFVIDSLDFNPAKFFDIW